MADDDNKVNATLDDEPSTASTPEDGEEESGGLSAKKVILFVLLPLFVLAGAGGGLHFTGALDKMFGGGEEEHAEAGDGHGEETHGDTARAGPYNIYFLEMPDLSVHLADSGGAANYLRLRVQLELASQSDLAAVEAVMPRVVDQFQTYLRELRVKDLRGSAGLYRLQMELLNRVNDAVYPVEVKDVLFQEILIQ